MKIKCCKDCVAPKRHPGCHGVCPEYLYEKALWEEEKKVIREDIGGSVSYTSNAPRECEKHLNIEDDNLHRKDKNLSFRY